MSKPLEINIDVTGKIREFCQTSEFQRLVLSYNGQSDVSTQVKEYLQTGEFKRLVQSTSNSSSRSIEIDVDVTGKMKTYFQTYEFKQLIKNLISERSFHEEFFRQMQIQATVKNEAASITPTYVRNEAERILPNMIANKITDRLPRDLSDELRRLAPPTVSTEALKIVPEIANKHIKDYIINNLPAQVYESLNKQFHDYIQRDPQAQQILNKHLYELGNSLRDIVHTILAEVTNDPNYHQITQAHLAALENKFLAEMNNLNQLTLQQLQNQEATFKLTLDNCVSSFGTSFATLEQQIIGVFNETKKLNEESKEIQNNINKSIAVSNQQNKEQVEQMKKLFDRHVDSMDTQISGLKSELSFWKWIVGGAIAVGGFGLLLVYRSIEIPTAIVNIK